jgi:protein TonB
MARRPASEHQLMPALAWGGAALLALTLHAGAVGIAMVQARVAPELVAEDVGAQMVIELAELPAAPEDAEPAVAAAAEAADSAPTQEIDKKLSAAIETDLPTAAASPVDAPPELQVAQDKTREKQKEAEEQETTEAQEARNEPPPSAGSEAAAAAAQMTPVTAETVTAPAEGSVAVAETVPESWQRSVLAHLGRHKRYPQEARSKRAEGEVLISFTVDHGGRIRGATLTRSSGSPALDREALDMLKRAEPLPALPARVAAAEATLIIPIRYRLK